MATNLRSIFDDESINFKRVTIKNNARIVDTDQGSYVIKKRKNNNLDNIYNYLLSRSFDYFPKCLKHNQEYDIYEYIPDTNEPGEQKILDLINLVSLLHNKTTYYKEIDLDNYKEIYESINNRIEYLYNYYTDMITIIERNVYMSPSQYLIARNISMIYKSLDYCKQSIDRWYDLIRDKRRVRYVTLHNNLNISHYLRGDKPYLISWDYSKKDMPIYDLLKIYQNHYLDYDFSDLFQHYENHYHLKEEERILLFTYMALPYKITVTNNEYQMCREARRLFDYIYKTEDLITNYEKISSHHH